MPTATTNEEPGFETDVNELPKGQNDSETTLEDQPVSDDQETTAMEDAQADAAEERKEGGYR